MVDVLCRRAMRGGLVLLLSCSSSSSGAEAGACWIRLGGGHFISRNKRLDIRDDACGDGDADAELCCADDASGPEVG
jgi:hypothetical protein